MFSLDLSCIRDLKEYATCFKCGNLMVEPTTLANCKHTFCNKCLHPLGSKCPKCQSNYMPRDVTHSDVYMVKMLEVVQKFDGRFPDGDAVINNIPVGLFDQQATSETMSVAEPPINERTRWAQFGKYWCVELGESPLKKIRCVAKRNNKGETPLHLACKKDRVQNVSDLIEKGVDINATDWGNWTPLHEAVQSQSVDCVKVLLSNGALVNVPGEDYRVPLHDAISLGNEKLVKLLLQYGADKNAMNYSGITPTGVPTTESITNLLNTTEKLETLPSRPLYIHVNHLAYTLCVSTSSLHLLHSHNITTSKNPLSKDISLCVVGKDIPLVHPNILNAILQGIMIVRDNDLEDYLDTGLPINPACIIPEIRRAVLDSVKNRLQRRPNLLDGMNFFVIEGLEPLSIDSRPITKADLVSLIKTGGGTILNRPPAERTVEHSKVHPYHSQCCEQLKACGNFIVYSEKNQPLLLYNMSELKHISTAWLIDCISNFAIKEWVH